VSYEVGTSAELTAFHVIPGMPPPEGERHSHDYRIDVRVERRRLDERGMVCDLDVLNGALQGVVMRLAGTDLESIRPEGAEAVTVEVLARHVHAALRDAVRLAGGEVLRVRVWESSVAFGGYGGPVEPAE
jgi:6-pyruvoyltetrahydropterin/6-carboxytetrahydropterin synthase